MRRALTVSLAVVVLAASVIVAHASTLNVNAGYLQVLQAEVPEFQPPQDPDSYAVTVYLFFYNRNHVPGLDQTAEVEVTQGGSYTLTWTGQTLTSSTCPSSPPTPPVSPMFQGLGTFNPAGSGAHILCLTGASNWNSNTANSEAFLTATVTEPETTQSQVMTETTPTSDDEVRSDDPASLGENCVDRGWQYLAAADGQPYADEQACVDDQVQFYYDNLRGDGS